MSLCSEDGNHAGYKYGSNVRSRVASKICLPEMPSVSFPGRQSHASHLKEKGDLE